MRFEAVGAQGVQLDAEVVQNGAAAVQGEAGAVITPHQSAEQTASPRGEALVELFGKDGAIERATSSSTYFASLKLNLASEVDASRSPEERILLAKVATRATPELFSAGEGESKSVDEIAARVAERMSTEEYKALIESEVTASLVGKALNSDKLLKRYANRDQKLIKRIASAVKQMSKRLDEENADGFTRDTVYGMVERFNVLLQMPESETKQTWEKKYKKETNETTIKAFSEIAVSTALYDALDHNDAGDDNLILMSKMPKFIEDKFGITGNFYVYRDHLYENTVSKERAVKEGRPTKRGNKDIHFHDLGEERMIEAIMSINEPIMSVEVHSKDNNPTIIMVLPVLNDDGSPLRAVLSFYSNKAINGSFERKPHIVLTITPCKMSESSGARKGWAEFISEAVKDGRVLSYDKEKGSVLSVIAQQARLGNITEASLNNSIARFKQSVNDFKQKNKINYDLGDGGADVDGEFKKAVEGKVTEKKKKAAEKKQAAKSGAAAQGEGKAIRTGSAEAGRLATRLGNEFGFKKATVEKIRAKLEALEAVFIKGTREEYVEEYKKRVQEIFAVYG